MHMVAAAGMGRYMRMVVGGYMGKVAWMGGGIFALRRPRPYSRHWRGFRCDASPPTIICAHMGINGNGEWEDHDAVRRVATSSEKRANRV